MSQKKEEVINEVLHVMKESAVDCNLNKVFNEENINCLNYGLDKGLSYYPNIKNDFIHVIEEKKKFQAKRGLLLKNGLIIFQSDNKKTLQYLKNGKPQKHNKELLKKNIDKKIAYDSTSKKVYDLDIYLSQKKLVEIGNIGFQGKLV